MKKILIIRFSSIGDVVLTSPIVRCIKIQTGSQIHYLIKHKYRSVVEFSPYIDKIHSFRKLDGDIIHKLKSEKYDFIIDLQNSFQSWFIKFNINCISNTVKKKNWQKYLFIYFGINYLNDHVVDRYFRCVKCVEIKNDHQGLDYFLEPNTIVNFNVNQKFIVWSIGGSFLTKKLSEEQIVKVCDNLDQTILLVGGKDEETLGRSIIQKSKNNSVFNFCGKISIDQSALLIKKSQLVLSNDTGLMHIGASFKKPMISFWGCTKPALGFYPYMNDNESIKIIANSNLKPCSKHGQSCRFQKQGCIKTISAKEILKAIAQILN